MRPFVVAVLLASTTAHVAAQSSISITGADRPSAATFAVITINGNGFDAANGAISVVFSARDAITVTVPAVTATATSVQVAVPPLINNSNGNLFDTSVVAEVQVVQATASSVMTSNTIGGLTIEPTPAASGAAGSFTRAFLRTVLDVQTDLRGAHRSTPAFAGVVSASQEFSDAQRPLVDAVEAIVANADRTINLPTGDNLPLSVSARTLGAADRIALAFVGQANAAAAARASSPAAEVPAGCQCNATTEAEQWLCDFRRNPCVAHETARKVVPELAVGVYGAQFGFLAGWAAGGLAGASLVASETASALGFLAGQAVSYGTAVLAGVDPPGAWSLLRDSGSTLLDDLTDNGLGVFSGLNTGISLGQTIESVVTTTRGQLQSAPRGGVVMPASQPANPPANTRPSVVYSAGQGARWIATAAAQQVTSLLDAALPPPTAARFDGNYTGNSTATCTVTVPDAPPITSSASGPINATVANGVVNAGGEGAGTVSPTGRFTAPAISAGGVSCSTGGRFWLDENGGAGATGFISCSGSGVGCSGTWNVTRSR
jgi:hypothetical protein